MLFLTQQKQNQGFAGKYFREVKSWKDAKGIIDFQIDGRMFNLPTLGNEYFG
jgi:hypothetical protein